LGVVYHDILIQPVLTFFIAAANKFKRKMLQTLSLLESTLVIYFYNCLGGENYNYWS
jgi:hypothetical protein